MSDLSDNGRTAGPTVRWVSCPTCARRSEFTPANPWRPFCSERCRSADLGAWASEAYRVPAKPVEGDEGDSGP